MSTKVGSKNQEEQPLKFPAKLEHLYEMLAYIKMSATSTGFTRTVISKIELACEEALVNIISHGYPKKVGTIEISCISNCGESLHISIEDDGLPFNPLQAVKQLIPDNFEEMKENAGVQEVGGYGIYFIVNMMDDVSYRHQNGKNSLLLTKLLNPKGTIGL